MKKTIANVGLAGLVLLGVTECHIIAAPVVLADEHASQSLSVEHRPFNMFDVMEPKEFERLSVTIDQDVNPWLDPDQVAIPLDRNTLVSILRQAGFDGYSLRMAQAIVFLESGNRPYAHNQNANTGDNSYGLFQINMFRGLEESRQKKYGLSANEDLFDTAINSEIAYIISDGGTNWSAWTTYNKAKQIIGNYSAD